MCVSTRPLLIRFAFCTCQLLIQFLLLLLLSAICSLLLKAHLHTLIKLRAIIPPPRKSGTRLADRPSDLHLSFDMLILIWCGSALSAHESRFIHCAHFYCRFVVYVLFFVRRTSSLLWSVCFARLSSWPIAGKKADLTVPFSLSLSTHFDIDQQR